jgi:hypothetical protein
VVSDLLAAGRHGSCRAGGWLPGGTVRRGAGAGMLWEMTQPQHASKDGEG